MADVTEAAEVDPGDPSGSVRSVAMKTVTGGVTLGALLAGWKYIAVPMVNIVGNVADMAEGVSESAQEQNAGENLPEVF